MLPSPSALVLGCGGGNGYKSDGGYLLGVTRKGKHKISLGWRKKGRGGDDGGDGGDSDGGYRSDAASGFSAVKAKTKTKKKAMEGLV